MASPNICVAHLIWRPLGINPFRRFAASFLSHTAGLDHELVLIFNGFEKHSLDERPYAEALGGRPFRAVVLPGQRQDIPAYFETARLVEADYLCFLNSHSEILRDDWLAKLYHHASRPEVGVAGATGSWGSHLSIELFHEGQPSVYNELLRGIIAPKKKQYYGISQELEEELNRRPALQRRLYKLYYRGLVFPFYSITNRIRYPLQRRKLHASFAPFPAPHLRTNAFMISKKVMLDLKVERIRNKRQAYFFEGGNQSLTNQIRRMGLKVVVVGADDRAFEPEEWHLSETLWQGEQRNLLVADNQTRDYADGSTRQRLFLSRFAWGDKANPARAADDAHAD